MSRTPLRFLVVVALSVLMVGYGFAQGGATGAIAGVVQDSSGAIVPDATVRIMNQDTGELVRSLKSDSTGAFTANLLPVGLYTVTVSGAREG